MTTILLLAVAMIAIGAAGIEALARHLAHQHAIQSEPERDEHEDGGP